MRGRLRSGCVAIFSTIWLMSPVYSPTRALAAPAHADEPGGTRSPALSGKQVEELLIRGPLEAMLRRPDGTTHTEDEVKAKAHEICEILIHLHDEKAKLSPADEEFANNVALEVFKNVHATTAVAVPTVVKPEPKTTVIQDKVRADALKALETIDRVARATKINNDDKDLTVEQRQTLLENAVINPIEADNPILKAVRTALNQPNYKFSKPDGDELNRMIREVLGLAALPVASSPGTPTPPDSGDSTAIQGAIKASVKKTLQTTDRVARTTNIKNNGKDFTPADRKALLLKAVDNPIEANNAILRTVRDGLHNPDYVLTKADHTMLATMISEQVTSTSTGGKPADPEDPDQPEDKPQGTHIIEEVEEVVIDAAEAALMPSPGTFETLVIDSATLASDSGLFRRFGRRRNRYIVPSSRSADTIVAPRGHHARYYIVEP